MRRLLEGLERAGGELAPRHLGIDELGRDVLSYLPGDVEPDWRRFADDQVEAGGRLLRRFHDATRALDLRGEEEVVCHGDAGPHNCIFRGGLPVALIDFDLAAPGAALDDVAYSGWAWCISSNEDRGPADKQARQLRLFADGYGLESRPRLVDAVIERQAMAASWWHARGEQDQVAWNLGERAYVAANRDLFLSALA